jgi:hypothetical protein
MLTIRLKDSSLSVRAKQGYYPTRSIGNGPPAKDLQFDLREAVVTGMDYNGVGLRLDGCQMDSSHAVVTCSILVDNNTLTFLPLPDGSWHSTIIAVISALDPKSVLLANRVLSMELGTGNHRPDNSFTKIQLRLGLPTNTSTIRIVVRDESGRLGTVDLNPAQFKQLVTVTPTPGTSSRHNETKER